MGEIGIMSARVEGMSWRDWLEAAVLADDLGYSSLSEGESWGHDAFTRLAQIAARTRRIRIGTSVVPIWGRSPSNVAMAALSLDLLSEGRFFLGLGTAGELVAESLHGERFERPLRRMREYVEIVRLAMRNQRLDYEGEYFQLHHFRLRFEPYREAIPIYIGALGPTTLRLTGALADGWLGIHNAPSRMEPIYAELAAGAAAAGRSLADIAIAPQISIYVTDDVESARAREKPHLSFYISAQGPCFQSHMERIGFGKEADQIRTAFLAGEYARAVELVTDELVDAVTIIGTPQQCRDRIQAYFDAGVDEIRLVFNEPDKESYLRALWAVAPKG
jgi:F420-dependent oxidoreductase-like protein